MITVLSFEELKARNVKLLNNNKLIYLATACNGRAKSRIVDYYNDELMIGFITWQNTVKIKHIRNNPIVSLCIDRLHIEGKATLRGHPSLEENKTFMKYYKERHPIPYKNFIEMENTTLVLVEPIMSILMTYEDNFFYLDHLDLFQKSAFRKMLSSWNFNI